MLWAVPPRPKPVVPKPPVNESPMMASRCLAERYVNDISFRLGPIGSAAGDLQGKLALGIPLLGPAEPVEQGVEDHRGEPPHEVLARRVRDEEAGAAELLPVAAY